MALDVADDIGGGQLQLQGNVVQRLHRMTVGAKVSDSRVADRLLTPMRRPTGSLSGMGVIQIDVAALVDRQIRVAAVAPTGPA
jgi:hypothetical protein